jgi:hypothetical protein
MPAYQQYQNFYPAGVNPYSLDPNHILSAMQNTQLTSNIYDGTNKTLFAVSDAQRQLTGEIVGVTKDVNDSTGKILGSVENHTLGLRDAIERGNSANSISIERTAASTQSGVERINSQLATAIERNGANGLSTTERVGGQVSTAVERNGANAMSSTERVGGQVGSAVERNGGTILAAIERNAGEGRLTTTVADAASRQSANDNARDIMSAVERNGAAAVGSSKDAFNGLLQSIERNAGENRVQTLTSSGILGTALTDVRHSILNDVNRSASDLSLGQTQSLNVLTKHVTDAAWEGRTAMAGGFQSLAEEHLRTKHDLSVQAAQQYASQMLEAQKLAHVTDSKADAHFAATLSKSDNHYASQMLEAQKIAHHTDSKSDAHFAAIISKTDNQYASLLLEQQKVKECLASQAANNFAINQLEQQKIKEVITMQLQDAKYEALKNKQDLSKEMAECCCEIKQKVDQRTQDVINTVDTLDRNRLRDEVNTINNENTFLKFLDFDRGYDRGYGRRHSRSRSPRRRSGSRERR